MDHNRLTLIRKYFHLGVSYEEITTLLLVNHHIQLSVRQLKRLLRDAGLGRRKHYSSLLEVAQYIQVELHRSGQCHGYRWMHLKCIKSGYTIQKEYVRAILKLLDPVGVECRLRRRLRRRQYNGIGPNYVWHVDSYDKLKPFGLCINGCIDGFSRYIVWLRVNQTSSDPKVIAGYYMDAVKQRGGAPFTIRSDMGTENGYVAEMQCFLRRHGNNTNRSYIYGTSQHNQRIESWWSILRKENAEFWISLFKQLKIDGHYSGSFIDKSLVQFCFMEIVQKELDDTVKVWNYHRIRPAQNTTNGRPCILYNAPELFDTHDCLIPVRDDEVTACFEECVCHEIPCDQDIYQLANLYITENSLKKPTDAFEALNMYMLLRNLFLLDL